MKIVKYYFVGIVVLIAYNWNNLVYAEFSSADNNNIITQEQIDTLLYLRNLPLADLLNVNIINRKGTLAARKVQTLGDTAAALFVITNEDIRRAGITSLPEALRMAPGIQVAHINANKWAISARGSNAPYSSKLLVMIDGRTVYSPWQSSVFWDIQDVVIEDIDRIEVIRGPGGALWGANAVNGIINIVTRSSEMTQGNMLSIHADTGEEPLIATVRHGGEIDNTMFYRVYGKFYQHAPFLDEHGEEIHDSWLLRRGGFRLDWEKDEQNRFTLQGDIYDGFTNEESIDRNARDVHATDYLDLYGHNILGRWQYQQENDITTLQIYYDNTNRDRPLNKELRDTYDIDFQQNLTLTHTHSLIWGLGFRRTSDTLDTSYTPSKRTTQLFSGFIQYEWLFEPQKLRFTIGSKLEHNDYTGFEWQPTIRLLWTPLKEHSAWVAISKAVRTPSRIDSDLKSRGSTPTMIVNYTGNPNFKPEQVIAYEMGYRFKYADSAFFDANIFFSDYNSLRSVDLVSFDPSTIPIETTIALDNKMYGEVYGIELSTHWQVLDNWQLIFAYSYLSTQLHMKEATTYFSTEVEEGDNPKNQVTLRSLVNLPHNMEFDTTVYYVDSLPNQEVASYIRTDMRLGWHINKDLSIDLGTRNLFDNQHKEFGNGTESSVIIPDEVPRTFYVNFNYSF